MLSFNKKKSLCYCQGFTSVTSHHNHRSQTWVLIPCTCHLQSRHHSKSRSIQSLTIQSTVRYPELLPDLVCNPLCILTRSDSFLHYATLHQSLVSSWSPLSFIPVKTNHHQHSANLIEPSLQTTFSPAICSSWSPFIPVNKYLIIHLPVVSGSVYDSYFNIFFQLSLKCAVVLCNNLDIWVDYN